MGLPPRYPPFFLHRNAVKALICHSDVNDLIVFFAVLSMVYYINARDENWAWNRDGQETK